MNDSAVTYQSSDEVLSILSRRTEQNLSARAASLQPLTQDDIDMLGEQTSTHLESLLKTFRPAISSVESAALRLEHFLAQSIPHHDIISIVNRIRGRKK